MKNAGSSAAQALATRVRNLRKQQGLSLENLAERSGVSRSMISLIERGETSPTAVVLEKLAVGLGVVFASLFDPPAAPRSTGAGVVRRHAEQSDDITIYGHQLKLPGTVSSCTWWATPLAAAPPRRRAWQSAASR